MVLSWLRDTPKLNTVCRNPGKDRVRHWLIAALACGLCVTSATPGWGQSLNFGPITLSVPSGSVAFPLELAKKIGADRAEGLELRLKFVNGGGVAISDLATGNAEFGVFGLPAAMLYNSQNAAQNSLVAMAAIDGLPLYSLVVRADLRKNISRIDDLKGRRIGVHSDSPIAITTSRQILNLVLGSRGISPSEVSIIPAGQSWDSQSSVFLTRTADAIMSDEPLATRFTLEKLGGTIYSTGNKSDISTTPGAGFLRATLIARRDKVERNSELSMRMVKVVQRSLAYMASRKAPELADLMALQGAERLSFINVFEK